MLSNCWLIWRIWLVGDCDDDCPRFVMTNTNTILILIEWEIDSWKLNLRNFISPHEVWWLQHTWRWSDLIVMFWPPQPPPCPAPSKSWCPATCWPGCWRRAGGPWRWVRGGRTRTPHPALSTPSSPLSLSHDHWGNSWREQSRALTSSTSGAARPRLVRRGEEISYAIKNQRSRHPKPLCDEIPP